MRIARTGDLNPDTLGRIKALLEEAYGEPFIEDWDHALGGVHFLIEENGEPISHASVVDRRLETGGRTFRTGYVEAVATRPDRQRRGLAARIMHAVSDHIRADFELGGLSIREHDFYERFGWETWRGPTFVRTGNGLVRTEDEDGGVMILRTASTPNIDLDGAITCEWRSGDAW